MQPLITIAFLSWNRLHYLKATLESAHKCIQYPNIEWIVSDNESEEPGLKEYLDSLPWLTRRIYKKQSHGEAMNQIVAEANGKYLMLWPDDVQFVVSGSWMNDVIEIMEENPKLGSIFIDALRRCTIQSVFSRQFEPLTMLKELYWYRLNFRRSFEASSKSGYRVRTLGWRGSGISGAGILSISPMSLWNDLGPWKTGKGSSTGLEDSSMGAEEYMFENFFLSRKPLQAGFCVLPVAADIVTDPLGCKAKVRGQYRYGVYMPPQSPDGLYYEIMEMEEIKGLSPELPLSFADVVKPIGFRIPTDKQGDRLKWSINTSVMFDIKNGREVDYPLILDAK